LILLFAPTDWGYAGLYPRGTGAGSRKLERGGGVFYVYLLRSIPHPNQHYVGLTKDLTRRVAHHNSKQSKHTAKYAPWEVIVVTRFKNAARARDFERYLKSGSGHAFAKRHFW